jgi:Putative peptidoglycan binding domain
MKLPNKSCPNHVKTSVKQLFLAVVWMIGVASGLKAQSPSPGSSPVAQTHKPKPIRVLPKQLPQQQQQAPVVKSASRPPNVVAYSQALNRYQHARHTRFWWKNHFTTIVLVGGGYYYWDAGYWFPAWGYDPSYESYDYDGPIFTYGNLLPDQVIVNVQRALQDRGYYTGGISGALSPATRRAISAFQSDEGLEVNGVVDGPTVYALGLI